MSAAMDMALHQWDSGLDLQITPLFLALQWAQRQSHVVMQPVLQRHALSSAELDILATLRNAPSPYELTPSRIQQEVVITSGGLTKVMAQLEQRGLIRRTRLESDLRVKPLQLTKSGRAVVEAAMRELIAATRQWVCEQLDDQEIPALTSMLLRLVSAQGAPGCLE